MAAPSLMTVPKEIRLRILRYAAEDVWPALTLSDPHRPPNSSRFGFWEISEWTNVCKEPRFRLGRESGLVLTCHTLREEILEVLSTTYELHLRGYQMWLWHRMTQKWAGDPVGPDISLLIPATYAALVEKVCITLNTLLKAWPPSPAALAATFPRLKQVFLHHMEPYDFSLKLGHYPWTVQELEEHAAEPALRAWISPRYEIARRMMKSGFERHIILTAEMTLGRFFCYEVDGASCPFHGVILVSWYKVHSNRPG